jgi:HAD superfamily hydrolase (TIGR01549 family)
MGFAEIPDFEIRKKIGLPASELFHEIPKFLIPNTLEVFREIIHRKINEENKLFPNVVALLEKIKSFNYGIGIATSKPDYLAKLVVKNSELRYYVDYCQGIDGFPGKPNPAVILKCMQELPSAKFIMIGDRPEDMQAGGLSGCFTIGVAQGVYSKKELFSAGANLCFANIEELETEFRSLGKGIMTLL